MVCVIAKALGRCLAGFRMKFCGRCLRAADANANCVIHYVKHAPLSVCLQCVPLHRIIAPQFGTQSDGRACASVRARRIECERESNTVISNPFVTLRSGSDSAAPSAADRAKPSNVDKTEQKRSRSARNRGPLMFSQRAARARGG